MSGNVVVLCNACNVWKCREMYNTASANTCKGLQPCMRTHNYCEHTPTRTHPKYTLIYTYT